MRKFFSFAEFDVGQGKEREYQLEIGADPSTSLWERCGESTTLFNIARLLLIIAGVYATLYGTLLLMVLSTHPILTTVFGAILVAYTPIFIRRSFHKSPTITFNSEKVSLNGATIRNDKVMRNGKNLNGSKDRLPSAITTFIVFVIFATLFTCFIPAGHYALPSQSQFVAGMTDLLGTYSSLGVFGYVLTGVILSIIGFGIFVIVGGVMTFVKGQVSFILEIYRKDDVKDMNDIAHTFFQASPYAQAVLSNSCPDVMKLVKATEGRDVILARILENLSKEPNRALRNQLVKAFQNDI